MVMAGAVVLEFFALKIIDGGGWEFIVCVEVLGESAEVGPGVRGG